VNARAGKASAMLAVRPRQLKLLRYHNPSAVAWRSTDVLFRRSTGAANLLSSTLVYWDSVTHIVRKGWARFSRKRCKQMDMPACRVWDSG
jgi:hypothetical protein